MIGDPSGRTSERQLLTTERVLHNIGCIKGQLAKFLDFEVKGNPARLGGWLTSKPAWRDTFGCPATSAFLFSVV